MNAAPQAVDYLLGVIGLRQRFGLHQTEIGLPPTVILLRTDCGAFGLIHVLAHASGTTEILLDVERPSVGNAPR